MWLSPHLRLICCWPLYAPRTQQLPFTLCVRKFGVRGEPAPPDASKCAVLPSALATGQHLHQTPLLLFTYHREVAFPMEGGSPPFRVGVALVFGLSELSLRKANLEQGGGRLGSPPSDPVARTVCVRPHPLGFPSGTSIMP